MKTFQEQLNDKNLIELIDLYFSTIDKDLSKIIWEHIKYNYPDQVE